MKFFLVSCIQAAYNFLGAILCCLLSVIFVSVSASFRPVSFNLSLPLNFCTAESIINTKSGSLCNRGIAITTPVPVFYILIHGTFSSSKKFSDGLQYSGAPSELIPKGFFKDHRYNGVSPIRLFFSWTGKLSDADRIAGGTQLAHGLDNIREQCRAQGAEPKFILVAHSHGGNVIAAASQLVKEPIDCAIFLGTPVMKNHASALDGGVNDRYLPKNIDRLFLFYSLGDFVQSIGAGNNKFKRRYGPISGIDLYNIRVLVDGTEPLHTWLYNSFIDQQVLPAVAAIQQQYPNYHNLIINWATNAASAPYNNLIAIKAYDTATVTTAIGGVTDLLWPDWRQFSAEDPQNAASLLLHTQARDVFFNHYGYEFIESSELLDRVVRSSQELICLNIIGKSGRLLSTLSQENKRALQHACCPFASFRRTHPQAAGALSCSTHPLGLSALSGQEKDIVCDYIGTAGRSLAVLPSNVRTVLRSTCCLGTHDSNDSFAQKHPNAAKALGCNREDLGPDTQE